MVLLLLSIVWCGPYGAVIGNLMRKLLKFAHSMTAITFLGSVVVLWCFIITTSPAEALEIYVAERQVMERVATLVMMPSPSPCCLALASFAVVPGYHGAPGPGRSYHDRVGWGAFGHSKSDQKRS